MLFHCYLWHGDMVTAQGPKRDTLCGDLRMATLPVMTRDWLKKPQSMLQRKTSTPEEAVSWLEGVFGQYAPKMAHSQATDIGREDRFGSALDLLRGGNDLSWGFPLLGSKYLSVSVITVR